MKGEIVVLSYSESVDFLLPKHYSGRIPCISYAFGWKIEIRMICSIFWKTRRFFYARKYPWRRSL
jgi:hypothetical protein